MDKARFLEMTSRARSESQCQELRAQLKEWEKSFADANAGRKPSKQDIKDNPAIAAKYRTYNRARDALDGKIDAQSLQKHGSSPSHRSKSKSTASVKTKISKNLTASRRIEALTTPKKSRLQLPPSHPSVLDPYDTSLVASPSPQPYAFKNAIGPTPERDGKVLGLFDLLSQSGSTPSTRKRKASCLNGTTGDINLAQTPSRRQRVLGEDLLGDRSGGGRRHSRTPASEGKKFLLSQYFATPGTVRFADLVDSDQPGNHQTRLEVTPMRTKASGTGVEGKGVNASENAVDATPAFLKRSTSFNQRLRTASHPRDQDGNGDPSLPFTSPVHIRKVPSMRSFKGKPLSELLRGLRQMEEDEHTNDNEDEDLDALREIENNEVSTSIVADSQSGVGVSEGQQPPTMWKKRGQKRTTRRVIMKPSVKIRKSDTAEEAQSDSEQEVEERVEETQLGHDTREPRKGVKNDNANDSDPDTDAESNFSTGSVPSDLDDLDELSTIPLPNPHKPTPKPSTAGSSTATSKNALADKRDSKGTDKNTSSSKATTLKKTDNKKNEKSTGPKVKTKTINPNAVAHANFRSLKIRSRGSKGRGGGRFGRGRR